MRKIVVGISEMNLSKSPDDVLVTYALGSCVGVSIYDPVKKIGGLIHCMLPFSKLNPEKAKVNPCMFVDTGILALCDNAIKLGAQRDRLVVKVAGAAKMLDGQADIGHKNQIVLRKILWKNGLLIDNRDVGGSIARTMYLAVGSGRVTTMTNGEVKEL